jgi:PmbA protein
MSTGVFAGDDIRDNRAELERKVAQTLELAKAKGGTAASVSLSLDQGLSVSVRQGEVETLEFQRDRGLGVTVYHGQSKGHASSGDLSDSALAEAVEAALSIAKYTAADPHAGLADADLMATDFADFDLYHPWDVSTEQAIELALEVEQAAIDVDSRITNSDGGSVYTGRGLRVFGNSHGFVASASGTNHSISAAVIAEDADGSMQRDYWFDSKRNAATMDAASQVGRLAGERTIARLGARQLGTMSSPVVYAAPVARGLIGHFMGAIQGGAIYRKSSFMLDKVGQQVFSDQIQIAENPHLVGGNSSSSFDGEGVATRAQSFVIDGVLQKYTLGSYSARQLGLKTTANSGGVRNLTVNSTAGDLASLLATMGTGLLVTELMGQGVNSVTGDYSRGASGFWVENGVIAYPVEEITIAGNLSRMYQSVMAVGSDVDRRGNIACGSIMLESMSIAGAQ